MRWTRRRRPASAPTSRNERCRHPSLPSPTSPAGCPAESVGMTGTPSDNVYGVPVHPSAKQPPQAPVLAIQTRPPAVRRKIVGRNGGWVPVAVSKAAMPRRDRPHPCTPLRQGRRSNPPRRRYPEASAARGTAQSAAAESRRALPLLTLGPWGIPDISSLIVPQKLGPKGSGGLPGRVFNAESLLGSIVHEPER